MPSSHTGGLLINEDDDPRIRSPPPASSLPQVTQHDQPIDLEVHVLLEVHNIQSDLPAEMFNTTPEVTGALQCKSFTLEARNELSALEISMEASPVSIRPPTFAASDDPSSRGFIFVAY